MTLPYPEVLAKTPRHPILYSHPSPIHPLPAISHPRISIFAKREDQSAPLACAGNKYRKLEYIVPDILSNSPKYHYHENHPTETRLPGPATTLVTEGAIQSNHTVQVAALARSLGLKALVLLHRGTGGGLRAARDKEEFMRSGNVQINRLLGAEVRVCQEGDPIAADASPVLQELSAKGEYPYWIPGGASLHALGGLGYARATFEIVAQESEIQLGGSGRFDYIFVACGSGSTVGGLIAGFKMIEKLRMASGPVDRLPSRNIIGVLNSPTKPRSYHEERVLRFAKSAGLMIGLENESDISMDDVRLEDRFVGTAYGVLDAASKEALEIIAQKEGLILDPVYTAKVARCMLQLTKEDEISTWACEHDSDTVNILFIHTGGQTALGAYA
ncbi:hypothetical protein N7495_001254 [Penicillium taxi]|uniref:uncharacterized protein n=1 Tax=Penicillium taxi TaxID=168475 RepID=UPI00254533D9|nr:uncharacterized protein N7495_001254 [Penicillium taxi]KAJ5908572.1 hypothetical protein N7495_001254 [Penicillium taxi]